MPAVAASLRVRISSLAALPRKSLLRPLKPLLTPSLAGMLVAPPSASSRPAVVAMAAEPRGPHSYADIESSLKGETLIELLPSWARRTICPAGSGCGDGECELLHVDPTWRDALASRHMAHGVQSSGGSAWGGRPRLIVCAGPERSGSMWFFNPPPISPLPPNPSSHFSPFNQPPFPSLPCPTAGSTWLFNTVRLLLAHSGQLALSYWLHSIFASKLRARGLSPLGRPDPGGKGGGHGGMGGERRGSAEGLGKRGDGEGVGMDGEGWGGVNVVVKTHEWAEGWEVGEWTRVVLLTERDVCGVADSYLRVGWLPHSMPATRPTAISLLVFQPAFHYFNLPTLCMPAFRAAAGAAEGSGLEAIQTLEGREGADGRAVDVRVVSRALAQLPVPTVPTVSLYFPPSSHVLLQPHPSPPNFLVGCSPPSNLPPTLTAGWAPDPVTKLWPRHKSKRGSARALTGEERAELQQFVASLAPPASAPTK
ncbi:unnamed protein product [Closterium sp. NIES-64]|nr:unnamed protein product [Closterium sp. NIES-64]